MKLSIRKIVILLVTITLACFAAAAAIFFASGDFDKITNPDENYSKQIINREKSYNAKKVTEIILDISSSDINFIKTNTDEIKVHYTGKVTTSNRDIIPELAAVYDDGVLKVTTRSKKHVSVLYYNSDTRLDVYIPGYYSGKLKVDSSLADMNLEGFKFESVECKASSGNLTLKDVAAGSFELETSLGKINLTGLTGKIKAKASSGNIEGSGIKSGYGSFETSLGRINLQNYSGDIYARSSSGNVYIEYKKFNNDVEIRTSLGKAELKLPSEAGFKLKAKASLGEIINSFPITVSKPVKNNLMEGIVGNGSNRVDIETSSGNIIISR